ncbi:MAG: AMP-binding protein [Calditrichaeota bacterium]|nr:AMP-binding protein [Calditrichota bacterium]MBT7788920.1 AMP-binding protein [Calditrichota bacterium]
MGDYNSHLGPEREVFPLSELTERSAKKFGGLPTMRVWVKGSYSEITFDELNQTTNSIAAWIKSQGIVKEDRIAVLGENSPEWAYSYLATQVAGAVVVPVDSMMPAPGIRHILHDSGAKLLFVSGKFLHLVAEMETIQTLETIVCFKDNQPEADLSMSEAIKLGESSEFDFPKRTIDENAAILYTSGTTGYSKGVVLSQRNIMSNVIAASRIFPLSTTDTFLSVLPVHHVFEATAGFLLPIFCGSSITYSHSIKSTDLIADIRNTNVTLMVGVPLLYEKMHAGMLRGIKKKGKKAVILFGTIYKIVASGEKLGLNLGKTLFKSLREKAGFASVRFFASGGGPLNPSTAKFFNNLGIKMLQGYGLTETSPVTHLNPPWKIRHECVGPVIPHVECKIIEKDANGIGEICVKGPNVFLGYFNNEEDTKSAFDEGWFLTGDLGIIHSDGYLQIMGRKKNMLVTGGGKNVFPEEIEHYLNKNRFITESLILGVTRKSGYGEEVGALIFPDYEQVDLHFESLSKKASRDDVHKLIQTEIKEISKDLQDYKRVNRFKIKDVEFEKTSTKKIKRYLYNGDMVGVG